MKELSRGTLFAERYEIIEKLGKGGLGKVYRVVDKEVDEEVALKVLNPRVATNQKAVARFRNELKLARKISHKNVCRVYHFGEVEETHYITMEYVTGENLLSLIRRVGKLPQEKAITIAKQICDGLAEAHRLGVVHRDMKPQNVMIDIQGNVRILDFGIARSLDVKGVTETGAIVGTPDYMSPEQVEGSVVDKRSDIYSLGIVLYEMVTGQVPFEGESSISVALKHKTETPRDPREINTQISEDLSRVILKCMEKDRERRFQGAKVVLLALQNLEENASTALRVLPSWQPSGSLADRSRWKSSIAVLPFVDLSPQRDQEYFCDGMAEELINALTKVEDLRTVARTSAFLFKGQQLDVREIGMKLNVATVLEGSVRKAGSRLRITAQLINVDDGYHLWSERYDREMDDVFAIQDDVTLAIVGKLRGTLLEEEAERLRHRKEDAEAYNLFLSGRFFLNKRTEEGIKKGMECFQKALESDPAYARAYAGLSDSYTLLGFWGFLPPRETFPKAKELAEKALEIDDTVAEAHCSLGWVNTFYDWKWDEAESRFGRAFELNPNDAMAHMWYAQYLSCLGRFDESIAEAKRAVQLDPLSLIINAQMGLNFHLAKRDDEAIKHGKKTLELDPNFHLTHWFLGFSYVEKGMLEEAIEVWQKAMTLSGGITITAGTLGGAYALSGRKDEALKMLERLDELAKEKYVSPVHKVPIYSALGRIDQAFKCLDEAVEKRASELAYLNVFSVFDSLRQDPRFKTLLKKIGLEK